jgi:CRP/FNR family transcriptional regulator
LTRAQLTGEIEDMGALSELKQAAIVNTLRHCRLFAGLPQTDLNAIALITVIKTVPKGGYLFREGEPARGFYIVQKGAVNVHRVNSVGKEQVIHIFRMGDSFAEATLATSSGYPADARAVEDSQVLLVQRKVSWACSSDKRSLRCGCSRA